MTLYAVLARDPSLLWIGAADSPEGACENARMQGKNPPGPRNILVVIASEEHWVYTVYEVSALLKETPEPSMTQIQRCPIAGQYFVDYL
ncbi:MAG: hypothetical protein KDJ28_14975 [Candidatus Competibacteraceae bacterium]|nr:hypothetical protein [Candidatus Competibacteraceae bacterium]